MMAAMSLLSSVLNLLETVRKVVASYVEKWYAVTWKRHLLDNLAVLTRRELISRNFDQF